MKKIYMTMVALLCGAAAMAQTASVTVPESLEIAAGSEGELTVGMTSDRPLAALAFRIGFFDGANLKYEIVQDWDDDANDGEGGYVDVPEFEYELNADRMQGHAAALQFTVDEAGFVQVAITSNPVKVFKETSGDLITLKYVVADTVEPGDYTVTIKKAAASTTKGKRVACEDVTIPLKVTEGTGINSINADDANAPIYNVAGQRVSKAQKGVFIQSGKKVAVK